MNVANIGADEWKYRIGRERKGLLTGPQKMHECECRGGGRPFVLDRRAHCHSPRRRFIAA